MHFLKKAFTSSTGYWLHKISTLPIGADIYIDIHKRINYGPLKTMFDVGANTGQTWELFRYNEPSAKIYCFEPVTVSYEQLQQKTKDDKNCVIEQTALGDLQSIKTIKLFDEFSVLNSLKDELMNPNNNAKEETISINTLDNYCRDNSITKIDFLKIDTEGYELNVLKGSATMLLNAKISMIYCEIGFLKQNNRNTNFSILSEWLAEKNYYFFGLYQLGSHGWKEGNYFGNALYIHKDHYNP